MERKDKGVVSFTMRKGSNFIKNDHDKDIDEETRQSACNSEGTGTGFGGGEEGGITHFT